MNKWCLFVELCQAIHQRQATPMGVKIYFLCGNGGMAYDFLLHQGTTMELSQQHKQQLGLGAGVVYHLCQQITEANHKLYFEWVNSGTKRRPSF